MRLLLPKSEAAAFAALKRTFADNRRILTLYARYLNENPTLITKALVDELCISCKVDTATAIAAILSAAFDLDEEGNESDARLFRDYIAPSVRICESAPYQGDPYFRNVCVPEKKRGAWTLCHQEYAPYEGFVCGHFQKGRAPFCEIPPLGFFAECFSFPSVMQNGQEWMAIKPNEIETMRAPLSAAHGRVLTYGLGLGYFAYMASEKESVSEVTVVERDESVISLFCDEILPQFSHPEKVQIQKADALDYAATDAKRTDFDFVFADLWHDTGDGLSLYLRLKGSERADRRTAYAYWIEDQLLAALRALVFEELVKGGVVDDGRTVRSMAELTYLLSDEGLRALAREKNC
jgi:hypothetical protein